MRPRVVLADEPTGNLDPATGEGVMRLLLDLNADEGTALVIVTHSDRLVSVADRALRLLGGGRLAEIGAPP
jgi:lipoprotein-releasing system ATP-binding protein